MTEPTLHVAAYYWDRAYLPGRYLEKARSYAKAAGGQDGSWWYGLNSISTERVSFLDGVKPHPDYVEAVRDR